MKIDEEAMRLMARNMARLMRETADMFERGAIREWSVNTEYGHGTAEDPRTGATLSEPDGWQTVTITMRGRPDEWNAAGAAAAGSFPGIEGAQLKKLEG